MAATKEEVEHLLRKLFNGGAIERVPKSRKDAEVFLALAAAQVESQALLTESELNEQLSQWLVGVADPDALDHVTLRRYLVDHAFLLRDTQGLQYQTNQAVISRYIKADARTVQPSEVCAAVAQDRERRRLAQEQ